MQTAGRTDGRSDCESSSLSSAAYHWHFILCTAWSWSLDSVSLRQLSFDGADCRTAASCCPFVYHCETQQKIVTINWNRDRRIDLCIEVAAAAADRRPISPTLSILLSCLIHDALCENMLHSTFLPSESFVYLFVCNYLGMHHRYRYFIYIYGIQTVFAYCSQTEQRSATIFTATKVHFVIYLLSTNLFSKAASQRFEQQRKSHTITSFTLAPVAHMSSKGRLKFKICVFCGARHSKGEVCFKFSICANIQQQRSEVSIGR